MKSSLSDMKKRGMVTEHEIFALVDVSLEELLILLRSDDACIRSASAINLHSVVDQVAEELLLQLSIEKCLYTRIAICETLAEGGVETARKMIEYLGVIGNNQHKKPHQKPSAKKSFPLARDIIARYLAKMDSTVLPVLMAVLNGDDISKICEVLDAIGYMVFYEKALANAENTATIINLIEKHTDNELVLWKAIMCLSAFPLQESRDILNRFATQNNVLGAEARRSLSILGN